jgi:hypothetical protein
MSARNRVRDLRSMATGRVPSRWLPLNHPPHHPTIHPRPRNTVLQIMEIFKILQTDVDLTTVKTHRATSECPWCPKPAFYYYL